MFPCPHCHGRTISLRAKIRANIFRPVRCQSCGALSIVSRHAVVGGLVVAELAAVPLAIAGPKVALMVLVGCVYSFGFAPMEQLAHAEPEPQWSPTTYVLAAMLLVALCLIPAYAIFRL